MADLSQCKSHWLHPAELNPESMVGHLKGDGFYGGDLLPILGALQKEDSLRPSPVAFDVLDALLGSVQGWRDITHTSADLQAKIVDGFLTSLQLLGDSSHETKKTSKIRKSIYV